MTTETINVPEIHCDHCKTSIEGALKPVKGISSATVEVPARSVTVTYDEAVVSRAGIVAAIEDQGYEVSPDQ